MRKERLKFFLIFSLVLVNSVFTLNRVYGEDVTPEEVSVLPPTTAEPITVMGKSIDPAEYILGTGDALSIDIWGEINIHHTLSVTPEGNLLIPRVGKVQVGGEYLAEAKNTIREAILRSYRNAQVTITLLKLRKVKVVVAGAVKAPGTYSVYANTRVSEVINLAGGFLDNSSRRNIILKRSYI